MEHFKFVDGRLVHQEFMCVCGKKHAVPIQEVVVRQGALEDLEDVLRRLNLGKKCVVIADLNTYQAAGEQVMEKLHNGTYLPKLSLFPTRELVKPDEYAIGKVMLDLEADTSFLLVVGSGSLTDLIRYISSRTGIPFVSVPTAASMDGYASSGAPMLQDGFKKTIISTHPHAIIADVDVFCRAPYELTASGFSDMLGKLTSRVDWKLSQIITGEYYCDYFAELIDGVVRMCVEQIAGIKQGEPEIMARLMEGLILSGIAMLVVGNSRPASGSEHSLSHYWEMKAFLEQKTPHLHGTKVGVATGVMSKFYEKFFARNPFDINLAAVRARKHSLEDIEATIRRNLGRAAEGVVEVARSIYLSWEEQQWQIEKLQAAWQEIKGLQAITPTFQRVFDIQQSVGASILPQEIEVDRPLLRETLLNAKEVRSKYTVLHAADTLGWLEEITDEVVSEY
ncbi:3-dehydroquinate synthase [Candidatus Vecturithrix granuli]|uniref:3-dehydroquinate synthase n=1 Tax=Vecturithrix granuli TaxID=1499967 RepID=A0A081C696_VECG1|nr:3-dehydroquinate synthase [Candidatus Vecturithrix granuli]